MLFSSHLLDEVSRVCDTVGVICDGRILETLPMQELADRYTEIVCELASDEHKPPVVNGFFGWQNRGREWSVAVDRRVCESDESIRDSLPGTSIRELRPISLERWFAARVSDPHTLIKSTVVVPEVVS